MKNGPRLCLSVLILLLLTFPTKLLAIPYYKGKVITIIVGYGPGGGYDRIARLFAKHLPKYIPGKPAILVQNMPGANCIIAANHLYNAVKPDGLNIGIIERGFPLTQLLKTQGVRFDLRKFSWIGSVASESTILCVRANIPYKTFDDVLKAKDPIMLGVTGLGNEAAQFNVLLKVYVGVNFKMVTYLSNADILLAVERQEVDAIGGSYTAMKPAIDRGLLRPLVRGRFSEPGIEELPVDEDLTNNKIAKTVMAVRSAPCKIGRPFAAPPKTPSERMIILQNAFEKVCNDPELRNEAKRFMIPISYTPAQECLKVMNFVLEQPVDIVNELSKYLL